MRLVIERWRNLVVDDLSASFGTRVVCDEYVLESRAEYPNSGWERRKWKKGVRGFKGFMGFDSEGRAKEDLGTVFGISSYQLVWLEEE